MQEEAVRKLNPGNGPSGVMGARVLTTINFKLQKKRPGAPKYVCEFTKLIRGLASEGGARVAYNEVEVGIWNTLLKCDERGKRSLKDEDMARREKEKAKRKRKKEKKKAKKKAAKERRAAKKKSAKQKR